MPQAKDTDDIAFTVPVKVDSLHPDGLRKVHVVVTKPMPARTNEHIFFGPFFFVCFLAVLLILVYLKTTGNKKFKRFSDAAAKLAERKW
jgi:hypothetical protein